MKKLIFIFAAISLMTSAFGQNVELSLVSRASYVAEGNDSYFRGENLCVEGFGILSDNFSVAFRQHLNKPIKDLNVFDATDYAFVSWIHDNRFEISAGKITTSYGSFAYDKAIYNFFGPSKSVWFDCFLLGLNFGYREGNNYFQAQITRSPFHSVDNNLVAFNLGWRGEMGIWTPIWSVNFFEYQSGKFQNHIALGNMFQVGSFDLKFDLLLRSQLGAFDYLNDFSVLGEMVWKANEKLHVVGRFSYECNSTFKDDPIIDYGGQYGMAGAGLEYFVLPNLRLHAYCLSRTTTNYYTLGLTWDIKLLSK